MTQWSPEVVSLARRVAEAVAERGDELLAAVDDAVAEHSPPQLRADPALEAEIRRSNEAVLTAWLLAVIERPGTDVSPVSSPATLDIVRDVARRGIVDETFNYFRVGQSTAARFVIDAAFAASSDQALIRGALSLMLASASGYIDRTVELIRQAAGDAARARNEAFDARRLDLVSEILAGADPGVAEVSSRLGFEVNRPLVALIVWSADQRTTADDLEPLARELADGPRPRLVTVRASASSVWVWLGVDGQPTTSVLAGHARAVPGARIAIGSLGRGTAGFRRSHLDAVAAQRVMLRLGEGVVAAGHDELRSVALAGHDAAAAAEFVHDTLGELVHAAPVLRETLRVVAAAGFDTAAAARELGTHRNTVLDRIRRARALLPADPDGHWIDIGLALQLDHWQPG